ncbi:unnamed protein product [Cyprideis torosa]|uniref:Uncharacterized protein n=1 Tax=Cyprideis torosa TaxID=163714 RepID=A0A7R8W7N0_9CRUS|nr:unnamed protein product [Cyprideis torosa]CAG0883414.1 unnamed protein product [Cyprideis torosa]
MNSGQRNTGCALIQSFPSAPKKGSNRPRTLPISFSVPATGFAATASPRPKRPGLLNLRTTDVPRTSCRLEVIDGIPGNDLQEKRETSLTTRWISPRILGLMEQLENVSRGKSARLTPTAEIRDKMTAKNSSLLPTPGKLDLNESFKEKLSAAVLYAQRKTQQSHDKLTSKGSPLPGLVKPSERRFENFSERGPSEENVAEHEDLPSPTPRGNRSRRNRLTEALREELQSRFSGGEEEYDKESRELDYFGCEQLAYCYCPKSDYWRGKCDVHGARHLRLLNHQSKSINLENTTDRSVDLKASRRSRSSLWSPNAMSDASITDNQRPNNAATNKETLFLPETHRSPATTYKNTMKQVCSACQNVLNDNAEEEGTGFVALDLRRNPSARQKPLPALHILPGTCHNMGPLERHAIPSQRRWRGPLQTANSRIEQTPISLEKVRKFWADVEAESLLDPY